MKILIAICRYALLFFLAGALSPYLGSLIFPIYKSIPALSMGGSFINLEGIWILMVSFEVLFAFVVSLLGDKHRYWILIGSTIIVLIPAVLVNDRYISWSLLSIVVGTFLGWLVRLICSKTLGNVATLAPFRKYF